MDETAFRSLVAEALDRIQLWERRWPPFQPDQSLEIPPDAAHSAIVELTSRLQDNYPFFHPDYAGQMLKPPHPVAMAAYVAAMRINPNNHALDGGPATAALEREAVAQLARMFGYDAGHLGHLTGSGTLANLEALWVSSRRKPGRAVVISSESHYTHERMCALLGISAITLPVDRAGRMDLDALRALPDSANAGTVVATAGTTAPGAVDRVEAIVEIASARGWRVHADAAYGGFFSILAGVPEARMDPAPWQALAACDSIVVDPHKHGLQPYGCGCVLFKDASVAELYAHDSPYTYYTGSPAQGVPKGAAPVHLGEISLECSRPGAAAAALWTTLRCLPLSPAGLGAVLLRCRQAALAAFDRAQDSSRLMPVVIPELDIISLAPAGAGERARASLVSRRSQAIFEACMSDPHEPLYVAKWRVREAFGRLALPNVIWDEAECTVLRSVLMKPEHAERARRIVERLEECASRL